MFESTISYQAPRARQAQQGAELTKYTTHGRFLFSQFRGDPDAVGAVNGKKDLVKMSQQPIAERHRA